MILFDAELPAGWQWEPLDRHYRITKRPRGLDAAAAPVPFVPMEATPAKGDARVRYSIREAAAIASGTYVERGDVLLSKITPSFENGKQGKADDLPMAFGYASTEIIPIQPIGDASAWYLFFYLLHPEVRGALAARMEGSTGRQRVPEAAVRELRIPVAPPAEQHRIADVLRIVQEAIRVRSGQLQATAELKQVAMAQLFTRGLRGEPQQEDPIGPIPASWDVVRVRDEWDLIAGGTPSRSDQALWQGGTVPWVKTGEIDYCEILELADTHA